MKSKVAVTAVRREQGTATRSIAIFVAWLLILQFALTGFAVAANTIDQGAAVGVACATRIAPSDQSQPAPPSDHHHGVCCILHCGALDGSAVKAVASFISGFFDDFIAPTRLVSEPSLRLKPERAPQSSRAPPPPIA